jgi:hypothetical protein
LKTFTSQSQENLVKSGETRSDAIIVEDSDEDEPVNKLTKPGTLRETIPTSARQAALKNNVVEIVEIDEPATSVGKPKRIGSRCPSILNTNPPVADEATSSRPESTPKHGMTDFVPAAPLSLHSSRSCSNPEPALDFRDDEIFLWEDTLQDKWDDYETEVNSGVKRAPSSTEGIVCHENKESGVCPMCFKVFVDGCDAVRIASSVLAHFVCFDQISLGDSFVLRS